MYIIINKQTNKVITKIVKLNTGNETLETQATFSNQDKAYHFMRNKKLDHKDHIIKNMGAKELRKVGS